MKYILMCIAALAVCLGCGRVLALRISKACGLSRGKTALLGLPLTLLLILAVTLGYLGVYYHADADAAASLPVQPEKIDGGYFFDGPGEDTALIFYPGAKVETMAYAPLMASLARQGVDCFLAEMPFRMAILGSSTADRFFSSYSYPHWAAAGHSMGGLVISGYAADHADRFDCLILLAAYPNRSIPDSIRLCSIYGSQDGCLDREVYRQAKQYWPKRAAEILLDGGNHAQYANYGPQSGDLEPGISREEQQSLTADAILEAIMDRP